jgi:hypothetical protein
MMKVVLGQGQTQRIEGMYHFNANGRGIWAFRFGRSGSL